jgi:hypothetical protein
MFLRNMKERGLCNGSRGVVIGFVGHSSGETVPLVKFVSGQTMIVERFIWTFPRGPGVVATRSQFPLALAWVRMHLTAIVLH